MNPEPIQWSESIECPECGCCQNAIVHNTWPWATRLHHCISCGYVIMESDWIMSPAPLSVSIDNQ